MKIPSYEAYPLDPPFVFPQPALEATVLQRCRNENDERHNIGVGVANLLLSIREGKSVYVDDRQITFHCYGGSDLMSFLSNGETWGCFGETPPWTYGLAADDGALSVGNQIDHALQATREHERFWVVRIIGGSAFFGWDRPAKTRRQMLELTHDNIVRHYFDCHVANLWLGDGR